MAKIRSKNTTPELVVRSVLHKLGFRFRIHRRDLPGNPDIVLPRHGKVVLVHGCFWHGHDCTLASKPKSNIEYWKTKIARTQARDVRALELLLESGWDVLEIWECEVRKFDGLDTRLLDFMSR
ncbi:very short patch repair endonuclease [Massilia sp. H-1]|nr:very short patch repair endonuclease [Massilia sp. H-1]